MHKEHGQVTGIIWRGPADLSVSAAAKQIVVQTLNAIDR